MHSKNNGVQQELYLDPPPKYTKRQKEQNKKQKQNTNNHKFDLLGKEPNVALDVKQSCCE